jgi:tetratricopeptide (TPR) repeat protein
MVEYVRHGGATNHRDNVEMKSGVKLSHVLALLILFPAMFAEARPFSDGLQQVEELILSKRFDEAERIIVSRMVTNPRDSKLITILAEVKLGQGHAIESLTLLSDAERLGGVTALLAHLSALANSAVGRLDLAEPQFRTAIRLEPNFVAAHYFLARLLYTQNRFDQAIKESKVTITLSPEHARAYENIGLCYEGMGQIEEAERWYLEAIRWATNAENKTEWPMLDLATMMIRTNRVTEAKPYLSQALAINPANAQSVFQMGVFLEKTEDFNGALEKFIQAINLDPKLREAHYHAARICMKLGLADQAKRYFASFKQVAEISN